MGEATAMKRVEEPAKVVKQESGSLFEEMDKMFNTLARRAYEIFDGNGRVFGRDLDNWLQAEREFLHPVALNVTETDEAITIKAEVPGFTEKDLEIVLEQGRLVITGQKDSSKEEKKGKTVYSEACSDRIMRVVDLATEVDADKVTATLKNGVLELILPKAPQARPVRIHPKAA